MENNEKTELCKRSEISPCVFGISEFHSTLKTPNSENVKNQYCYRLMLFDKGAATVEFCGNKTELFEGDVFYMLPDTPYRVLNTHGDFDVFNLWFDFFMSSDKQENYGKTVFARDFNKHLCRRVYSFDEVRLNAPRAFRKINCVEYARLIKNELSGLRRQRENADIIASHLMNCILEILCRDPPSSQSLNIRDSEIVGYIKDHLCEKLTAEELSTRFHYHENHIGRIVKAQTGLCLRSFILKSRTELAEQLSEETDMTVTQIAQYLGFFDASHFTRTYRRIRGVPFARQNKK